MGSRNKQQGFTLIEVLVSITIFISVIVIGSTAFSVNYIAGQPNSIRQTKVNSDMQFITETIRAKASNANANWWNGSDRIKGFSATTNSTTNMISFATGSPAACAFIGWDKKGALYMLQELCGTNHTNVSDVGFKRISSPDVKITGFEPVVTENSSYKTLDVKIKAVDSLGNNPTEIDNTYYLGSESLKGM